MDIEIYADVVCPWCWIGKRRLEQALESYDGEVNVRFRPFQLDPTPVTEPKPLLEALGDKFGGRDKAEGMAAHVTGVAAGAGLDLRFDRAVAANTFDAHRLVRFAAERGRSAEMVERLYRAHFHDGIDVGSIDALVTLAGEAGLDETEAREYLESNLGRREVAADLSAAHQLGVSSVPTFVLAGKYAVTGAQEPETLLAALREVAQREAAA
ncbi:MULTISPECIES: DsbA family protein [Micromonospora]|uniref:DsbA family oxidoreductase n=1 Tax=Micromonospora TaxID=1873 RepID=UPI0003EEC01B|nr:MULTISPECIES: DsbA family oxidoreductase [unclassified Micromonospora]EWM66772.1 FrnE protein [Micromonospora sp. M42]MCK1805936.1 DsbA family oxidoreductase [Micromonospora sp. R42106]MCK1830478.1 DsbA family oxidoreductase [Micromonospora sp. R42003]MCK1842367.1 DsbA family oxidoreductase [Micromonospora sp. R42004]MCM1018761.1 DsbA family oxidoreductase [Micromonospora sp. XM-20-01]